jgi:glycosyltransferase involved in cell wall biosynthesis
MNTRATRVMLLFWGSRGGGSVYTRYLAEHLHGEDGVELGVSLRKANEEIALLTKSGIPVFPLDFTSLRQLLRQPWTVVAALHRHMKALKSWQPDIAIVTMNGPFAWPYIGALRAIGCRIVYVAHDARPHPGDYARLWQRFTQSRLLRLSDVVVTLSQFVADELARERPELVLRTVALDAVYPERAFERHFPLRPDMMRFLVLGRLIRYKGFDILQDAVKRLPDKAGWSLTIAGQGPLRDEIDQRFSGLANVALELNWLTDDRMFELMAEHDVLVCNYSEASQSGLIAQALSCGMPVVATGRGALPEQLKNGAGTLTDGSAEDLAAKMNMLMAEPERLQQMAQAARKLFADNKHEQAWLEIIRSPVATDSVPT